MKTTHSITPGRIIEIDAYAATITVQTRLGEILVIPSQYSESETLDVVVHSINGKPISVQGLSTWANVQGI